MVFLDDPSAILELTEITARLICDVSPNFSSDGKLFVKRYISLVSKRDCCQTLSFSKE